MLFLFHGQDLISSRQALVDLKKNYKPLNIFTFLNDFDFSEFKETCEAASMFGKRLVVVEIQNSKFKIQNSKFLKYLETLPPQTDVLLWLGYELKGKNPILRFFAREGKVYFFKEIIPKTVFPFLDALGERNKKKAYLELHRLLEEGEKPVYLLSMTYWQVRNLSFVKHQSASGGSNLKQIHPYVLQKLKGQVKKFSEEELLKIYEKLLKADLALKTSTRDPILILDGLVEEICG